MQAKTAIADFARRQRELPQALQHLVAGLLDVLEIKVDDDLLELRYVVLATRLCTGFEHSDAIVDAAARLVFALRRIFLPARGPPRHPYRKVRVELRRCQGWGESTRSEAPWQPFAIRTTAGIRASSQWCQYGSLSSISAASEVSGSAALSLGMRPTTANIGVLIQPTRSSLWLKPPTLRRTTGYMSGCVFVRRS